MEVEDAEEKCRRKCRLGSFFPRVIEGFERTNDDIEVETVYLKLRAALLSATTVLVGRCLMIYAEHHLILPIRNPDNIMKETQ